MNKRKIAVGPGASSLILIAVVLALSVLTVLTMIAARNDEALAVRSVETRQEAYGLFAAGEESMAKLDAVLVSCLAEKPAGAEEYLALVGEKLPEGMKMTEDRVSWTEKTEKRTLECAVRIHEPGEKTRMSWTRHALTAEDIWEDEGFDDFGDWGDEEEDAEEDSGDEASEEESEEEETESEDDEEPDEAEEEGSIE